MFACRNIFSKLKTKLDLYPESDIYYNYIWVTVLRHSYIIGLDASTQHISDVNKILIITGNFKCSECRLSLVGFAIQNFYNRL